MKIRYFSNFEAQSSLQQCTDSPDPSLITEIRNNIEICYFSNFEPQSSLRLYTDSPEPSLIAKMRKSYTIMGVVS